MEEKSDKEIIESLNFMDFYEASYRFRKLKTDLASEKGKNTKRLNKAKKMYNTNYMESGFTSIAEWAGMKETLEILFGRDKLIEE